MKNLKIKLLLTGIYDWTIYIISYLIIDKFYKPLTKLLIKLTKRNFVTTMY